MPRVTGHLRGWPIESRVAISRDATTKSSVYVRYLVVMNQLTDGMGVNEAMGKPRPATGASSAAPRYLSIVPLQSRYMGQA
jgi:hypothetical protein